MPKHTSREQKLILKSFKEDGVEEILLPRAAAVSKPVASVNRSSNEEKKNAAASSSMREQFIAFRQEVLTCTHCAELASTRNNVVFGSGNIRAKLMFVGEAPGHDEDLEGLPFVGKAGQLLTKIIEAMGLTRQQVFIANVLKCRPPGNRQPQPDEILNCQPYLMRQIEWIRPQIICALGTFAAQTLLKTGEPISRLRGRYFDFPASDEKLKGIKIMCTYHPAYLLRNPADKKKVWQDMQQVMQTLGLPRAS